MSQASLPPVSKPAAGIQDISGINLLSFNSDRECENDKSMIKDELAAVNLFGTV